MSGGPLNFPSCGNAYDETLTGVPASPWYPGVPGGPCGRAGNVSQWYTTTLAADMWRVKCVSCVCRATHRLSAGTAASWVPSFALQPLTNTHRQLISDRQHIGGAPHPSIKGTGLLSVLQFLYNEAVRATYRQPGWSHGSRIPRRPRWALR